MVSVLPSGEMDGSRLKTACSGGPATSEENPTIGMEMTVPRRWWTLRRRGKLELGVATSQRKRLDPRPESAGSETSSILSERRPTEPDPLLLLARPAERSPAPPPTPLLCAHPLSGSFLSLERLA